MLFWRDFVPADRDEMRTWIFVVVAAAVDDVELIEVMAPHQHSYSPLNVPHYSLCYRHSHCFRHYFFVADYNNRHLNEERHIYDAKRNRNEQKKKNNSSILINQHQV